MHGQTQIKFGLVTSEKQYDYDNLFFSLSPIAKSRVIFEIFIVVQPA
jgi:hypothetical protein